MTPSQTINVLILGAGKGTRMGGVLPKVLHTIGQRSMLCHVLASVEALRNDVTIAEVLIVHGDEQEEAFAANIAQELPEFAACVGYAEQRERLGTGHAVQCGVEHLSAQHPLLVLYADQPLMQADGLAGMIHALADSDLCIATFMPPNPTGLGRIVQNTDGGVTEIVEEKDANTAQKAITLCNAGVMAISAKALPLLHALKNDNAACEYYLTDMVSLANADGLLVQHRVFPLHEMASVNTLAQLAEAEAIWQDKARLLHMNAGVQMLAPDTVYFSVDSQIGAGCFIEPNVVLGRGVTIAENTRILAFSHLEQCEIGQQCQVGPFSRIRPNSTLEQDVRVGNFVEIKNAHLHAQTRAGHLAYLGDCLIEQNVNIGAGTITCNYDGFSKSLTHIEQNAFIGSNSSLVAPINIGKDSIVGAGSVVSNTVPDDALTLERSRQLIVKNGAKRLRARAAEPKESAPQKSAAEKEKAE